MSAEQINRGTAHGGRGDRRGQQTDARIYLVTVIGGYASVQRIQTSEGDNNPLIGGHISRSLEYIRQI